MGVRSSLKNGRDFLARQSHNYRMMIVRSGGGMFLFNLTGQYSSIFTKALGADNMTIAWLSSVSSFISMLISMPVGYVTDNYNLKKVMGAGLFLNIAMVGMYAFAQDWRWIFVAMVINPFTMALMFRSQQLIITNELDSAERARGMGVRMQIAMILGLISPIPAAFLVKSWGGLTLEGIRPLYYIRFVGMIIIYSYVYIKLTDVLPMPRAKKSTGFIDDFREVLDEGGRKLKVMIVVGALGALVWSTIQSFTYLYAAEIKGADELILGLLPTVETIAFVLFATPMNNLADTKGRKYAFLLVRPALWMFFVLVILAPNQYWLLVAWFLRGIGMSTSAYNTLFLEMVPAEQRGRWMGLSNTFSALIRIGAPLLGGLMYDSNLPWLLFAVPLAVDMLVRIPIFHFYVPETLPKQE
ncbi:MAG: MFS transporter [Candidatus Bathyarchaeia archaeon]